MLVKFSFEGEFSEIREIIDAIESSGSSVLSTSKPEKPVAAAFVRELAPSGQTAVRALIIASIEDQNVLPLQDRSLTREEWQSATGLRRGTIEDQEFNGVLGSIGRAWAKVSRKPNPFVSQGQDINKNHIHVIQDSELVYELYELLDYPAKN